MFYTASGSSPAGGRRSFWGERQRVGDDRVLCSNCRRSSAARLVAHDEVYLVVQSIQASNQTLDRKLANPTGDKRGNIRLLQPECVSSLGLGKLPTFDDPANF